MVPPTLGVGLLTTLLMARPGEAPTVDATAPPLLLGLASGVPLAALAVLAITVPWAVPAGTSATTWKVADWPAGSVAMVSVMALPTWLSVAAGPPACDCET